MIWLAVALAHDPTGCPPLIELERRVRAGPLADDVVPCVTGQGTDTPEGRAASVVAWRHAAWQPGYAPDAAFDALLAVVDPDAAVWMAEVTAPAHPDAARRAAARAWATSNRWTGTAERAHGLVRLAAVEASLDPAAAVAWAQGAADLGVVSEEATRACTAVADPPTCATPRPLPALPPDPPSADDLARCADVGRLWTRAAWGTVYASDVDCLVRGAATFTGDARDVAARLALRLAERYRDPAHGLLVAHRVAALLPGDPDVGAAIARLRAAASHPDGHPG